MGIDAMMSTMMSMQRICHSIITDASTGVCLDAQPVTVPGNRHAINLQRQCTHWCARTLQCPGSCRMLTSLMLLRQHVW